VTREKNGIMGEAGKEGKEVRLGGTKVMWDGKKGRKGIEKIEWGEGGMGE
jgi:hypothetical protein